MTTSAHSIDWALRIADDINEAERAVLMTALSFLPPRTLKLDAFCKLWIAIAAAADRGVAVQVALPMPALAHPATLRNDTAAAALRAAGAVVVLVPTINLLHAKTVVIDARIAWVGSGNMTAAAAHHNRECWLRTIDARAVAEVAGFHGQCFKAGQGDA